MSEKERTDHRVSAKRDAVLREGMRKMELGLTKRSENSISCILCHAGEWNDGQDLGRDTHRKHCPLPLFREQVLRANVKALETER